MPATNMYDPQQTDSGVHTLLVSDADDADVYLLQHAVTSEGVVIDVYDRDGTNLLFTDTHTWDDLFEQTVLRDASRRQADAMWRASFTAKDL